MLMELGQEIVRQSREDSSWATVEHGIGLLECIQKTFVGNSMDLIYVSWDRDFSRSSETLFFYNRDP